MNSVLGPSQPVHDNYLPLVIHDPAFGDFCLGIINQLLLVVPLPVFGIVADDFHHEISTIPCPIMPGMKVVLVEKNNVRQPNLPRPNSQPNTSPAHLAYL